MLASWEKLPLWNSFCSCYNGHFSCLVVQISPDLNEAFALTSCCFQMETSFEKSTKQLFQLWEVAKLSLIWARKKKKRERERVHRLGTVTWWTLIPALEKSGVEGQELVAWWWRGKGEGGLERCLEGSDSRMRLSVSWGPADEEGSLLIHPSWKGSLVFSAIPKLLVLCSGSYTDEFVSAGVEGSGSGGRQCSQNLWKESHNHHGVHAGKSPNFSFSESELNCPKK